MTDMDIGPAAEYPDFGGNSLTGAGLGARRNAESCQVNVCNPSMARLKPCTMQGAIQELNQKEGNGKENTTTKTKIMVASAKKGGEEVRGEGRGKCTYPVWA